MFTKFLIATVLLLSTVSKAEDFTFKYGLGFGMPNQVDISESKYISLGIIGDLSRVFKYKLDGGAWFDPHPEFNRASAGFGSASLGIRVEPSAFYMETYWGGALISQTDAMLSTNFEFTEELGFGVKDKKGKWCGFEYRHFSNAGIQLPNKGRDFFLINFGFEL